MTQLTSISISSKRIPHYSSKQFQMVTNLQQLIDKKQVLRVMQPALIERVKIVCDEPRSKWQLGSQSATAVSRYNQHPNILCINDVYYFSLHTIRNEQQRKQTFHLLKRVQIGENIDVSRLPRTFQQIIQPDPAVSNPLFGSMTFSLIIGVFLGLCAMAIGILFMTIAGTSPVGVTGVQKAPIIFIVATFIGWLIATAVIWAKSNAAAASTQMQ